MADLKTKKVDVSAAEYVAGIGDAAARADCETLTALMQEATGDEGKLWSGGMGGSAGMVGFGDYHYRGASGRSGVWFSVGFSPRKANLTIYFTNGFESEEVQNLLGRIGKHTVGKGCLYTKRLADIDQDVLKEMIAVSYARAQEESAKVISQAKP